MSDRDQDTIITKLREEISFLENVIGLLPGHVYWLNRDNVYLGCNNLQAKAAKLNSPQDIVGKKNCDLIAKDEADSLDGINLQVMETGEAVIIEETTEWSSGARTYLTEKVPLCNAQGETTGLLGVSFDISERKRMEKELKEAKVKAEISNQAKSDFIRNMEHDIRTPLSGIFSVASYLASIEKDAQKKELLDDLESAAQELIAYLNSVIEISRLSEGGLPIILKEFDLEGSVRSMFMLELPAAKNKQLDFILNFDERVPKIVIGDSFRTYRILLNLVSNAIKFTPQGFVKISVHLASQNQDKAIISFCVEDSGIGISEQDREKIYEKFSCGTQEKGRANTRMGLGLWIVKQFLQDIEGGVELESILEKGSKFTCQIPYKLP